MSVNYNAANQIVGGTIKLNAIPTLSNLTESMSSQVKCLSSVIESIESKLRFIFGDAPVSDGQSTNGIVPQVDTTHIVGQFTQIEKDTYKLYMRLCAIESRLIESV